MGGRFMTQSMEDALQSIQLEHRLGRSLDDFFNARKSGNARADLDDYWTSAGLTCGPGGIIATYSRRVFSYGLLVVIGKLLAPGADYSIYIGFEGGAEATGGIADIFTQSGGAWSFRAGTVGTLPSVAITNLLPATYLTANNTYAIKVNKFNAELWINGVLKAVALLGLQAATPSWTAVPYALVGGAGVILPAKMSTLLELNPGVGTYTLPIDATVNHYVAADGDPMPPRQYPLYTENTSTLWTGLATGGTLKTSHPVPVWGYTKKTLYFMATAGGVLTVQGYLGGGWRTIATPTVVANTLVVYDLAYELPIARCTYEPANADTITLAEWCLS